MRGIYRGDDRAAHRAIVRRDAIPSFIKEEIDPLAYFLSSRDAIVAIDGGSNKGFWSKALLDVYRDKVAHIYMIDASPENYAEITNKTDNMIFDSGDFSRLTSIHCALTDSPGVVTLYTNEDGSPIGSLFPHTIGDVSTISAMGELTQKIEVRSDTIDNIIAANSLAHVDIVKLDIEGNEFNALKGAEKSLSTGLIDTVAFEFGIHQVDARNFFRDFWGLLRPYGYHIYKVVEGNPCHIPEYSYHHESFTTCWNFIASRR